MIFKAIRLIALCASMFGYMRYFSRKIAPELSIGFTFVSIGSVMFLAGLLNVLPETAILVSTQEEWERLRRIPTIQKRSQTSAWKRYSFRP